ncbi:MAG: hypothetical protein HQL21_01740 [Candidatus Omnitrophica bacterium]|nr:hypothetical protein [Candidatus Omnitrophota bacterium]
MKPLLIITCTVRRPYRKQFIRECVRTFVKVSNMLWIVVEDGHDIDPDVERLLVESGIPYKYFHIYSRNFGNSQKNLGLTYIRDNHLKGIVYIADDDNRYDVRLFEEIRRTKKISIFPVGNRGPTGIERPIVRDGKIVGWDANWSFRKFPVDQAGYAVNADVLDALKNPLWAPSQASGETDFIEKVIQSSDEFEILCDECHTCYVWHNDLWFPWPLRKVLYKVNVILKTYFKFSVAIIEDPKVALQKYNSKR